MLSQLIDLFAGKRVRITHTSERLKTVEGICKTVYPIEGATDQFDLELENGHRFGFVSEVITSNSVEGELRAFAGGQRKIQPIS